MKLNGKKQRDLVARQLEKGRRALGLKSAAGHLCIEITSGTVRLAETRRTGGPCPPPQDWDKTIATEGAANLHESLTQLLEGFTPGDRKVILALNPADLLVRKQNFPSTDPREIEAMIPFQAAALLPLPAENFIVRHRIVRSAGEGRTEVAIIAVRRSLVEQRVQAVRELGFEIDAVHLSGAPVGGPGAVLADPKAAALDFLPPAELAQKQARAARSRFLLTIGLVLYCLAAVTFLVEHRVQKNQGQLDEIYAYLQATDPAAKQLKELQAVNDRMTGGLHGSSVLDWLRELSLAAPAGVTLSEVTVDQGVATVVRGQTSGADRTLDFVEALRHTKLGAKATLEFAGSGNTATESETSFEIRIAH